MKKALFTGALNQKPGSFEMATGHVFLDEVSTSRTKYRYAAARDQNAR